MTLATQHKWDTYIDRDLEQGLSDIDRQGQLDMLRQHIETWRETEWPQIKQQLSSEFNWHIRENVEPYWTSPGKCILWQRHIVTVRKQGQGKNAVLLKMELILMSLETPFLMKFCKLTWNWNRKLLRLNIFAQITLIPLGSHRGRLT